MMRGHNRPIAVAMISLLLWVGDALAREADNLPQQARLVALVRSAVILVNHANQTGNYTVLRDMAAPAFQRTNSAARLGTIFAKLRQRDFDLMPILIAPPTFTEQPAINDNGFLHLTGYFPTYPEQVMFDLVYQHWENEWKLFNLRIYTAAGGDTVQNTALKSTTDPAPAEGSGTTPRRSDADKTAVKAPPSKTDKKLLAPPKRAMPRTPRRARQWVTPAMKSAASDKLRASKR